MIATRFADALKKGTGRAVLLLRDAPDDETLHAALLAGCEERLGYDLQCEPSRARWLVDMIKMTRREQHFFERLLVHLDSFDEASSYYDIKQVYELLCLLAADDPTRERSALRTALTKPAVTTELWAECATYFIRLVGLDGFVFCVELFQSQLREDFQYWGGAWLGEWIDALKERDGSEVTTAALEGLRAERTLIDEMLTLDSAREPDEPFEPESLDYAGLKSNIASRPHFPRYWIKQASQAEIDQAAADLLKVTDAKIVCAYLMIFTRRRFPLPPDPLFRFLGSDDRRQPHLAAKALGLLSDSRVRALAFDALAEGRVERALELLPANYQDGDFVKIDAALQTLGSDDDVWHGVGYGLLDLLDKANVGPSDSVNALILLYEKGPCPLCRTNVVKKLLDLGRVPDWMTRECELDCDSDTRELLPIVS